MRNETWEKNPAGGFQWVIGLAVLVAALWMVSDAWQARGEESPALATTTETPDGLLRLFPSESTAADPANGTETTAILNEWSYTRYRFRSIWGLMYRQLFRPKPAASPTIPPQFGRPCCCCCF